MQNLRTALTIVGVMLGGVTVAGAVLAQQGSVAPIPAEGWGIATDGETIKIGEQRFRLWGIDAPERNQPFGEWVRNGLQELLVDQVVTCKEVDVSDSETIARCMTPDTPDLGESQVAAGWAVFEPSFFGTADEEDARRYARAEIAARQSGLGMWTRSSPPLDLTGLEAQIKRLADQGLNDPDNMESTLLRWQPLAAALLMGLGGLFLLIFAIVQGRTVHDAVRR